MRIGLHRTNSHPLTGSRGPITIEFVRVPRGGAIVVRLLIFMNHVTSILLHSAVAVARLCPDGDDPGPRPPPLFGERAHRAAGRLDTGRDPLRGTSLRVEVVAWASCQPYLPCALFSLLSFLAYLRAFDRSGARSLGWVAASWLLFLLALLSKAVAVTLPAVLIILDIALLRRIGPGNWMGPSTRRVWLEKIPFLRAERSLLIPRPFRSELKRRQKGHASRHDPGFEIPRILGRLASQVSRRAASRRVDQY